MNRPTLSDSGGIRLGREAQEHHAEFTKLKGSLSLFAIEDLFRGAVDGRLALVRFRHKLSGDALRQAIISGQAGRGASGLSSLRPIFPILDFMIMMIPRMRPSFWQLFLWLTLITLARPVLAAPATHKRHLAFVLILARHGVRAPGDTPQRLHRYSVDPWPQWPAPPDYLTLHGYEILVQFGAWDRNWLIKSDLLPAARCGASKIYVYADSDERTIRSGDALAKGLSPSCSVTVHSLPQGTQDPLFHFSPPSLDAATRVQVIASVRERLHGGLAAFTARHKNQLDFLQGVLDGCETGTPCPKKKAPAIRLQDISSRIQVVHSHDIVSVKGPVFTAASLAEDLLLEYTQGLPRNQVGWGRVSESQLREIIGLHTAEFSIRHRVPALARIQMSNLLDHLLLTLRQEVQGRAVQGSFGPVGKKVVVVDGHDTDIAAIAGLLHLHWTLDGRADDTPPGTQLQFLVYRGRHGHDSIQLRIVMQTLDQMRHAVPLTSSKPPASAILKLHCSMKDQACSWKSFQEITKAAIDRRFVVPLKQ